MLTTYTVKESTTGRTLIILARTERKAVIMAKVNYKLPVNGNYVVTKVF